MARIFSIQFNYNDETYSTMVAVKSTPLYIEYTLLNLDFDLLLLLPGNKIISPAPKQFLFPHAIPQNSAPLMSNIIRAVAGYLQTVNF